MRYLALVAVLVATMVPVGAEDDQDPKLRELAFTLDQAEDCLRRGELGFAIELLGDGNHRLQRMDPEKRRASVERWRELKACALWLSSCRAEGIGRVWARSVFVRFACYFRSAANPSWLDSPLLQGVQELPVAELIRWLHGGSGLATGEPRVDEHLRSLEGRPRWGLEESPLEQAILKEVTDALGGREWRDPAAAGVAGECYRKQVLLSVMDPTRLGGWVIRSPTLAHRAAIREQLGARFAAEPDTPEGTFLAYCLVIPTLGTEALDGYLGHLKESSPVLYQLALVNVENARVVLVGAGSPAANRAPIVRVLRDYLGFGEGAEAAVDAWLREPPELLEDARSRDSGREAVEISRTLALISLETPDLARWREIAHRYGRSAPEYPPETLRAFRELLSTSAWTPAEPPGNPEGLLRAMHVKTGLEFVLVPAGSFLMGSPAGDEHRNDYNEHLHRVAIERPFLICATECTQQAWERGGGENGSRSRGADLPVERVTWEGCRAWCAENGLRLPSEAEWEYACRAGTATPYSFGDRDEDLVDHAWYYLNSGPQVLPYETGWEKDKLAEWGCRSRPVRGKRPNPWGLFDVHGNVEEWCEDRRGHYHETPDDGSAMSGGEFESRIYRGGYWSGIERWCRSAYRSWMMPDKRNSSVGFRPARSL